MHDLIAKAHARITAWHTVAAGAIVTVAPPLADWYSGQSNTLGLSPQTSAVIGAGLIALRALAVAHKPPQG